LEEARRFLRYIVPGLTLIIEFLGYLLISGDICFRQLVGHVNTVGAALSVFLASGGLGFLLGVIYYTVAWWNQPKIWKIKLGAYLRPILEDAESKSWLQPEVETTKLSKRGAWRVIISYLNMNIETSKPIKGALQTMNNLADLMNGLGTTCVASLAALVSFLTYNVIHNWRGEFSLRAFAPLVIGSIMLIFHYRNYKGVIEDYENVVHQILLKEFQCEYEKNGPIELHFFQNDLRSKW
jgi:hypothetical protein